MVRVWVSVWGVEAVAGVVEGVDAVAVGGAVVVVDSVVVGIAQELAADLCDTAETQKARSAEEKTMFQKNKSYFIRTVTYHAVGTVVAVKGNWIQLKDASWVADSGRFMQAIKDGTLNEVEPVGDMIINADSIVDAFPWKHACPSEQK